MVPVARQQRRPNGAKSKNLNIRVPVEPVDILARAHERAASEGVTLSAVVVGFLREYGEVVSEPLSPACRCSREQS